VGGERLPPDGDADRAGGEGDENETGEEAKVEGVVDVRRDE
jgi:hypothetical protein